MIGVAHQAPRIGAGHPTRADADTTERGAVLVEMAMVALMMLMMVAAVWNYGIGWREGLAATEAARSGARVGSGQGIQSGADFYALNSIRASLDSSGLLSSVVKVVIFKSTTTNGSVPSSCLATAPSGTCNVVTGAQLQALTSASFNLTIPTDPNQAATGNGCLKSSAATLANWCPTSRNNVQSTGADFYGVYVELSHHNPFPFTPPLTGLKRTVIMQLEPTDFGG